MGALLSFLRAYPGPADAIRRSAAGGVTAAFAEQLSVHGLSGVAHAAFTEAGVPLGGAPGERLGREALGVKGASLRNRALLVRCLDALAGAGIVPAMLKGHGLAVRLYEDPLQRLAADVDLLVRSSELASAEAAIAPLGLAPMGGPEAAYARAHHHSVNFESAGQLVEIHHRALEGVGHALPSEGLIDRSTEGTLEGKRVRWLSHEDELAYLAAHAAGHAFARLSWLLDLKLYVAKVPVDWERLASLARTARIHGPAYFGLEVARRAVGAAVPDEALRALRPPRLRKPLVDALFDEERLEAGYFWTHRYAGYVATPLVASDVAGMTRYVAHHLWRGSRRKLALRFPALAPAHWRG